MTDMPPSDPVPTPSPQVVPEARARRSRWIGLVWAVPLAALLIAGFLGLRAFTERGVDVIVTFESGGNAHVDDTKVIFQGIEAGRVTKIAVNKDGRRVDMTLRLDPRAELRLTTSTVFWLVGANPSINDISSVKAALAGVAIGVAPGTGGTPTRHFSGMNEPPIIMPGTPGTPYVLTANTLGTASLGSPLFYRGQQIGKVVAVHLLSAASFQLDIFINAPFDKMISPASLFWVSSPVQVSLAERGASATLEHAGALFNGAIEFDTLESPGGVPRQSVQSPAHAQFPIYRSRGDALTGPTGPEVPYAFRFKGPAGELTAGAAIRLMGFQVGVVRSTRLDIDAASGVASTSVEGVLYPEKLHIRAPVQPDTNGWQRATDAVVNRLLATGHRARLVQTPPLIGGRVISFDVVRGAGPKIASLGAGRQIPSDDTSAGFDEITAQVNELLGRLNRIPLDDIGRDVQQLTGRLNSLVASPQLAGSLAHLNSTLAQADKMMGDVAPQVGPLVAKLNRAADEVTGTVATAHRLIDAQGAGANANLPATIQELSDAARSIRSLADYIGRHPESLIRGRGTEPSPEAPKGKR